MKLQVVALAYLLATPAFAGPPYVTDDPEPVSELQHALLSAGRGLQGSNEFQSDLAYQLTFASVEWSCRSLGWARTVGAAVLRPARAFLTAGLENPRSWEFFTTRLRNFWKDVSIAGIAIAAARHAIRRNGSCTPTPRARRAR